MISQGLKRIHRFLLNTETVLLVLLLLSMIVLAVVQILMRNFLGGGLVWVESFVRILVLWLALLGAMVASRQNQHIAIDVLVKKLPKQLQIYAMRFSSLFTALICFAIAWHSLVFVQEEYDYGAETFGNVPIWLCESIIPFAFFIIALRYFFAALLMNRHYES